MFVEKNIYAKSLTVITLSMGENNVDSLRNIIDRTEKLNLIISDYFYSHERNNLIPYIYQELDIDDKFQLSITRTHAKIVLIQYKDNYIVMHGSANLRSSANTEQLVIENNKDLYDFFNKFGDDIQEQYKTINHDRQREKASSDRKK